ncbi:MAG: glycosyltransferase family 2 protein [Pararhodobacter sp.]|nr:glycosyltransferase family 2 protein [Pararhodobacter sp.]
MLPFSATRSAQFRCEADLSAETVFNLDFYDAQFACIPFHLSLRRDEGVAVVNRRDLAGWRRELVQVCDFSRGRVSVDIRFAAGRAVLRLDGQVTGRFDRFPRPAREGRFWLRRGFPGLGQIAHVCWVGAMVHGSLSIRSAPVTQAWRGTGFMVNDRMEAIWRGLDAAEAAQLVREGLRLQVSGLESPLEVALLPLPYQLSGPDGGYEQALSALLPGRIWAAGTETVELRLIDAAGTVRAQAVVTRQALREAIERQAATPLLRHDDLAALQALEHVRLSGIAPQLGAQAQGELVACADFFGLTGWFSGEGRAVQQRAAPSGETALMHAAWTGLHPAGHGGAVGGDILQDLRNRFTATLRATPDTDPAALLTDLLTQARLSTPDERMLVIILVEWFCTHGDPRVLHSLAQARGHRFQAAEGGNAWHLSAELPLMYLDGQFDAVADACALLARRRRGWLVTPALAWVAGQAAQVAPDGKGGRPAPPQRDAVLGSFLDVLLDKGADYWERTPCLALIRACVSVLLAAPGLSPALSARVPGDVLRLHALSPDFWAEIHTRLSRAPADLPARVAAARAAFHRLSALVRSEPGQADAQWRQEVAQLLDGFDTLDAFDSARFRRDLLGPLRAAEVSLPVSSSPQPASPGADEALLRWLAFPHPPEGGAVTGLDQPVAEAVAAASGRAVAAAWQGVPHSLSMPLHRRVANQALMLVRQDTPAEADLRTLTDELMSLADETDGFLGLTLLIRLACSLMHRGRADTAQHLTQAAHRAVEAMPPAARAAALAQPGPSLALAALQLAPGGPALASLPGLDTVPAVQAQGAAFPAHGCADGPAARHLFDTLVCVYSCRANLDTRIQALRRTWLADLQAMGVPFLVFVGDGNGECRDDVVYLNAPDDYEGLPQKTLAMARWVHENTRFSYLLKVDDDCFLDAEAFFTGLSFLKFDYYGRRLHRVRGQLDRSWHMAKAGSPRGRLELDKSPEPSAYADGGSGYVLSRRAMGALIDAAQGSTGRALIQRSFMEDKLVGDLLALHGIQVAQEDYRAAVMRRGRPGGPLVPQWENGFLPFRGAGISLAHLDGTERMAEVGAGKASVWPLPKKIWPSFQPLRLGARSNALDLMSSPARLAAVNTAPVAVVACLRNEAFMLPHFLNHYRALGVQGFLIADNGSDDGTLDLLAEAPDVALFAVDTDYGQSHYGVAWQQALMANFRVGRWSLVADADELLVPGNDWQADGLPGLLRGGDFAQADAARIFMLDMYPKGPLSQADFADGDPFAQADHVDSQPFLTVSGSMGPFSLAPVFTSALRHRLIPGSRAELFVAQKYALLKYRPWMRPSDGLHFVAGVQVAPRDLLFAHFKYNAAFRAKAVDEVSRRQHFNNAEEYRKYLALVSEGREVIHDPAVSVPWQACTFVQRIMAGERA